MFNTDFFIISIKKECRCIALKWISCDNPYITTFLEQPLCTCMIGITYCSSYASSGLGGTTETSQPSTFTTRVRFQHLAMFVEKVSSNLRKMLIVFFWHYGIYYPQNIPSWWLLLSIIQNQITTWHTIHDGEYAEYMTCACVDEALGKLLGRPGMSHGGEVWRALRSGMECILALVGGTWLA